MACRSINLICPLTKPIKDSSFPVLSPVPFLSPTKGRALTTARTRTAIKCSVVQESSASTATAETKDESKALKKAAAAAKAKLPAKAPPKPLSQLIEEDVIPSLKTSFESQDELSEIQVSFQDNRLEGSFMKNGTRYTFWAFFPDGILSGPKGFSLSSYGSGVSTVEPFLIDEKKITGKHVVFWVEKRLAAQGILPVWKE